MSISNAYDMGLLSRTFQVNNIFKVYLYICTHNKPSRFIFSNSNIRHVIAILVLQSRTATIQIQKNRGAIEIRFVSVSSHIPELTHQKKLKTLNLNVFIDFIIDKYYFIPYFEKIY